jgi:hypothetical protein
LCAPFCWPELNQAPQIAALGGRVQADGQLCRILRHEDIEVERCQPSHQAARGACRIVDRQLRQQAMVLRIHADPALAQDRVPFSRGSAEVRDVRLAEILQSLPRLDGGVAGDEPSYTSGRASDG